MVSPNPRSLVNKLNTTCRRALEAAAGLCLSRTNRTVEIEHWLLKLLEPADTDLSRILRHYEIDPARVVRELTRSLDRLKTGSDRPPTISQDLVEWMREAWVVASLEFGTGNIRSGYLLCALLADESLALRAHASSAELARIPREELQHSVHKLVAGSAEDAEETAPATTGGAPTPGAPLVGGKTPALDQFTIKLTERARKGEIDPVVGRDFEIRQMVDILTRRRQNNPILTGEAGVGKTAVVEGFALRVVAGDVPASLKDVAVRTLDLGLLQAGAGVKGEFENRLKSVIQEVKASPQPIILFIDEAHTIIGAGGQAGQGDAANLLKPALARGELRTIAATTWAEYKKYFEKDAALKRRFQVVKVDEPDEQKAMQMMRTFAETLEKHHKVRILDEAIADAVRLSHRYITDRQLPDKSVSLLDTVCARVALGQSATPPALEDCIRQIEHLDIEIGILQREKVVAGEHAERVQELLEQRQAAEERRKKLEQRWEDEKTRVTEIQKLRTRLEAHAAAESNGKAEERLTPADEARYREELVRLQKELVAIQGETPLVQPVVDGQAVAEVVSGWTGIPAGKMVLDEIRTLLNLKEKLGERVVGQSHALEAIVKRIRTARAGLTDPRRPIGVFMLVGPSGVGKTETALALADVLYGGERNIVTINMSEYQEAHTVSGLKGSPPGYVGYGEGGVLTEAVRRKPYCVVLLDEIEKAHTDVQELFYQVFDKGTLEDAEGREIDFKNTIILLTSNVGTDTIMKVCSDPETRPDPEGLAAALRPDLLGLNRKPGQEEKGFKPAFLGRLVVVPYYPLGDDVLRNITKLNLGRIAARVRESHGAAFTYDDALVNAVVERCQEVETGARNIDHILTGTLLPEISREFLSRMAEGKPITGVHVSVDADSKFAFQIA
jgi:type VI secretion system protein VasG